MLFAPSREEPMARTSPSTFLMGELCPGGATSSPETNRFLQTRAISFSPQAWRLTPFPARAVSARG